MFRVNRRTRSGQAAIMITLTFPLTLGLVGLVVDMGWAYWREEACRTAAQAAAFASAMAASKASNQTCGSGVTCTSGYTACPSNPSSPPSTVAQNGCLYAKANGFTTGGNNGRQNVQYDANTTSSPVSGVTPAYWVRFVVAEKIPTLFTAVLGQPWMVVSARSTGGAFASGVGGCLYVLDPSAPSAYNQNGSNFSTGCGIYVNSNSGTAGSVNGSNLTLGNGTSSSKVPFTLVGGLLNNGSNILPLANVKQNQGGSISNPISGLTAPSAGACQSNPNFNGVASGNVPAGTYCSGITINGSSGITLGPGIIDVTGGNMTITGSNVTTAGGGVNLYFAAAAGNLTVNGSNVTLTAKSGGALDGIAIWKDGSTLNSSTINGSNTTINGIIYMPRTNLTYNGSNTPVNQTIVCDTIIVNGGNISQPATSGFLNNGGSAGGTYLIE